MTSEFDNSFEYRYLEQKAREEADAIVAELRSLIASGVTSFDVRSRIAADCLHIDDFGNESFQPPEWLPRDAAEADLHNWDLWLLLGEIEVESAGGAKVEDTMARIHADRSQVPLLDRVRLAEGIPVTEFLETDESPNDPDEK